MSVICTIQYVYLKICLYILAYKSLTNQLYNISFVFVPSTDSLKIQKNMLASDFSVDKFAPGYNIIS